MAATQLYDVGHFQRLSNTSTMTTENQAHLAAKIRQQGYVADADLISSLYLMDVLGKPLLVEGEAGVGKTEIGKCLAALHGNQLIRLQCYEGLDAHHALYDWDYQRQLLTIQMADQQSRDALKSSIYSDEFLLKRPLLAAIASPTPVVLLIDEIDRADEEFEALLLEVLSDFQISIPELGTYKAVTRPRVVLTSNGVRELSDALRRRCLYHYVEYPDADKEMRIIKSRLPDIDRQLAEQVVNFVQQLRLNVLRKTPGIAETLDWAASLSALGVVDLKADLSVLDATLTSLLKTREDLHLVRNLPDDSNLSLTGKDNVAH